MRNISEHQYGEKLINNMQVDLNTACDEYSVMQEKITQMSCVNFELEHQLKDAKERLEKAEMRARQAEEQAEEIRQNCEQQKDHLESLQSQFLAKVRMAKKQLFHSCWKIWIESVICHCTTII